MSGRRSRAGSDASVASRKSSKQSADGTHRHTDQNIQNDQDVPAYTMKDSILAAASKLELPSVRWPALSILLELSWDEELKMSLVNCNVPEPWQNAVDGSLSCL